MKVKTLSALAGLGSAMILSTGARADLVANTGVNTSLSVEAVTSGGGAPPAGLPRTIYHVYANFTAGTDRVETWGIGGVNFGPGGVENLNALGVGPGLGFTNIGGAVNNAPFEPGTTRDWDSYATLGLRYANQGPVVGGSPTDAAGYSPGFPNFATGTSVPVPASGMAVFITPDDAQGAANWIDSGSDTSTRVLLMQLVVNTGDHVQGTIGLVWSGGALAGSQVASGLSFTTVPAPGALALLGLAGLVGSRRRRA
jgi:MYXO-CTERM domain-containing protein